MAVIVTRAGKGSPLTNNEVDANFINLNTELGLKASAGANSDITSMSGITGGISTADYIDIDTAATPTGAVARMRWDDGNGTLQIGMKGGNVNLQVGQEMLARVYNDSGAALTDGQIVYISGSQGNRIAVKLANADSEATSAGTLGMVTEPIAIGAEGFINIMGVVNGLNTSALTAGQLVYLSTTAGAYTTTAPLPPNHRVIVGYVERVHATVGSIYVKVDNGYELEELHNVSITSVANDQVLQYESATSLWKNKTLVTLPSQTGNSGKFLTTDGTNASWATVDLTPYLAKSGGTMTGAITFAAGQTWPTFNQNTTGSSASCTGNAATATTATTATTANALNTANNYQGNSLGVGTAASGTAGEIRATNNITAYYSDVRLKTKIGDIVDPLAQIRQIETMVYHANETAVALGYDASIIEVGLNAQSVQRVQPYTVAPAPIDPQYLTVRYERLVPLLIESVKALDAIVAKLVD